MKRTVYEDDFIREFKEYNLEDSFSHEGLCLLFNYLERYEEDTEEEIELDVISFCYDYSELTYLEFTNKYSLEIENYYDTEDDPKTWEEAITDDEEWVIKILTEYINKYTMLVGFTDRGTVVYQVW